MSQQYKIVEVREGQRIIKKYIIPETGQVEMEEYNYIPLELISVIEELTKSPNQISFLLNEDNEILQMNFLNMSNQENWITLDASTINYRAIDALSDQYGIPLYKLINNEIVEVPEEERESRWPIPVEELTDDDIVDILADQEYRICLLELGIEEDELYDL